MRTRWLGGLEEVWGKTHFEKAILTKNPPSPLEVSRSTQVALIKGVGIYRI
jgi:hypothetical protein